MAERLIEKQKETQKEPEVNEHNGLVEPLGMAKEDTAGKHCNNKESEPQSGDSTAINGRGMASKGEGDITNLEIKINNEYSSLVPELTTEEYELLKESIKQDGLWVPLIVNQDGVLLDGHHRYKACQELGIEPYCKVKGFKNEYDEKLFVIGCNLKRRQLNNFQRIELALKSKSIKQEIARKNSQSNLKNCCSSSTVRNLTVDSNIGVGSITGRVDEQIGELAGVSRDTVRKVEKILQNILEEGEIMQKLRTGEMSINQAYESISKEERIKKQEQQYMTIPSVTSSNIMADSSTAFTAKTSSHPLGIKQEDKFIKPPEKSMEDLAKQNYQMKQEIEALRKRINYLEQINQQEQEWSYTKVMDIRDKVIPIKVTVNNVKREVVYMEIDVDYIKRKKRECRDLS